MGCEEKPYWAGYPGIAVRAQAAGAGANVALPLEDHSSVTWVRPRQTCADVQEDLAAQVQEGVQHPLWGNGTDPGDAWLRADCVKFGAATAEGVGRH